jgi:hypothetical protein
MTDTIWAPPAGQPGAPAGYVDAGGQAQHAIALADNLGLGDVFTAARRLLKRSHDLGQQGREAQARAQVQRGQLLARLIDQTGPLDPAEVLEVLADTGPWITTITGAEGVVIGAAPAMDLVMEAARNCRGRAAQAVLAESPGLYTRLQRLAGECVQITVAQPEPPSSVWGGGTGAAQRAMVGGYERAWGELARAADRFGRIHELGGYLRRMGALGQQAQLDLGEPWGWTYLEWEKAAASEHELRSVPPVLRLRYAAAHGWQPGLWLRADHERHTPKVAKQPLLSRAIGMVFGPDGKLEGKLEGADRLGAY